MHVQIIEDTVGVTAPATGNYVESGLLMRTIKSNEWVLATAVDSIVSRCLHRTAAIKSILESMGKKVKEAPEPETPAQDAAAAVKKAKKAKLSTEEGTGFAVDCPVIRSLNDCLNRC